MYISIINLNHVSQCQKKRRMKKTTCSYILVLKVVQVNEKRNQFLHVRSDSNIVVATIEQCEKTPPRIISQHINS